MRSTSRMEGSRDIKKAPTAAAAAAAPPPPPPPAAAGEGNEYVPLPLIGQIREKGYDLSKPTSRHWQRISAPEPRASPFPVARHRSDGPHWTPPSQGVQSVSDAKEDQQDDNGELLAANAEPLVKKKKNAINFSKWKAENGQKKVSAQDRASESDSKSSTTRSSILASMLDKNDVEEDQGVAVPTSIKQDHKVHVSSPEHNAESVAVHSTSTFVREYNTEGLTREEDLNAVNDSTLESMTIEQIAEAQQELADRFRPDILEMLRKRGKKKAEKQSESKTNIEKPVSPMPHVGNKSFQGPEKKEDKDAATSRSQGPHYASLSSVNQVKLWDHCLCEGRSWAERVEAVRSYYFGLDGNIVDIRPASASFSTGEKDSDWRIPNLSERDFLRMEGDPSSVGYTIKEAVALARSMVPAQRSAAMRLLGNILSKAMFALQLPTMGNEGICTDHSSTHTVDWQAVWAYALGPEPDLVLTLRMALDDSHATVIVACARALELLLSSSENEHFFNLYESSLPGASYMFTAPVFQKPLFKETGLIGDCYWKYNVKSMDMFPFSKSNKSQGEDADVTVKDDASVANQDAAAGLIRMGILPRIRYLLEVERLTSAEDSLFGILIALSRHSPAAADAVMKCPRLMDTIQQLFALDTTLTWPARPKVIRLLKVLSIASKSNCLYFIDMGIFKIAQLGLLRQCLTLGKPKKNEEGNSWSEVVESLSFWRICISYGLCISCFSDFYPALLFWLAPPIVQQPTKETMDVQDAIPAVVSFHLLAALAGTLPILHGNEEVDIYTSNLSPITWSWKFAIPLVENSLDWLRFDFVQSALESLLWDNGHEESSKPQIGAFLQVISLVLHFLSTVCGRILKGSSESVWLPTFIPKLVMQLVKSGLVSFGNIDSSAVSLVNCYLKRKEKALCRYLLDAKNCICSLVRLLKVLDGLLVSVNVDKKSNGACKTHDYMDMEEILKRGLLHSAKEELMQVLRVTGDDLVKKAGVLNMVGTSRRGGPAPGLGIGWGCQGGGYWSLEVLAAQIETMLVIELMNHYNVKEPLSGDSLYEYEDSPGSMQPWRIKVGCSVSLVAGLCHKNLVELACCVAVMSERSVYFYLKKTEPLLKKCLLKIEKDKNLQEIDSSLKKLSLKAEDISDTLLQHVKSFWLCRKSKSVCAEGGSSDGKHAGEPRGSKRTSMLSTIPEDSPSIAASDDRESLAVEWAGQKMPLPSFWFWSSLLIDGNSSMRGNMDTIRHDALGHVISDGGDIIRHGLLLLFGLEALEEYSPSFQFKVPVTRKIHALSAIFIVSDDIFLDNTVSSMVGALQEIYLYQLDSTSEEHLIEKAVDVMEQRVPSESLKKDVAEVLDFEALVDERYPSFLDKLTSQYASVSYGDLVFGRQVAIYLRRDVPESLRLRVWKSLESEHMLGFLPQPEKCCGSLTRYVYPAEESQEMLKAYASAWASGALDKAITRRAMSFWLAVSHIAAYIFSTTDGDETIAAGRKTFAKSLLLQLAQRSQFQTSLAVLVNCKVAVQPAPHGVEETSCPPSSDEIQRRCTFLEAACAPYSHLVDPIRQLKNQ